MTEEPKKRRCIDAHHVGPRWLAVDEFYRNGQYRRRRCKKCYLRKYFGDKEVGKRYIPVSRIYNYMFELHVRSGRNYSVIAERTGLDRNSVWRLYKRTPRRLQRRTVVKLLKALYELRLEQREEPERGRLYGTSDTGT